MSSKFFIPAPVYTQTPNVFFDEIMHTLNEGEMKIILIIMRQTFGWHKAEDWISASLLARKTGFERRSVFRIISRLIKKGLISKRTEGVTGSQKCYYSLVTEPVEKEPILDGDGIEDDNEVVESEEDKKPFKKIATGDREVTGPVTEKSRGPVTEMSPTKETPTKKTQTKLSVVSAGAATSKAQIQDPALEEKTAIEESDSIDNPMPSFVKVHTNHGVITVTETQLYQQVMRLNHNWPADAIQYAWRTLASYSGIIYDWWKFFEGAVNNYIKRQKSETITKSKGKTLCQDQNSKNCKPIVSDVTSLEQLYQTSVALGDFLHKKLPTGSTHPKASLS